MARFLILIVAGIIFGSISANAAEKPPCGERAMIVEKLNAQYKEVGQARGLVTDTRIVEIFVSPQKSWTMLVSFPNGSSCIMASGEAWDQSPVALAGNGV
jgi:hypothetical protein